MTGKSTTTGKGQLRTQIFSKLNEFTLQNHIKDPQAQIDMIKGIGFGGSLKASLKGDMKQSAKIAELDKKFLPERDSSEKEKSKDSKFKEINCSQG